MIQILHGDCLNLLPTLPENSVDAVVTDPPYHLTTGKRGGSGAASLNENSPAGRSRIGTGFMGMAWDGGDVAMRPETWAAVLRVAKPGAYLLAFGGTRTHHRIMCAIEDAGWEIRDVLMWVYSSGFPKSMNIDRERGRAICGCETEKQPSASPERDMRPVRDTDLPEAVDARAKRGEVLQSCVPKQGTSQLWSEGSEPKPARPKQSGMEGWRNTEAAEGELQGRPVHSRASMGAADGKGGRIHHGTSGGDGANVRLSADTDGGRGSRRPQSIEQLAEEPAAVPNERGSQARGAWPLCGGCGKPMVPKGYGTALKPAYEPIILARKPLEGTVLANVLAFGTGGLNIDGCRIGTESTPRKDPMNGNLTNAHMEMRPWMQERIANGEPLKGDFDGQQGRWPANLIHDGSDEVVALFPREAGGQGHIERRNGSKFPGAYGEFEGRRDEGWIGYQDAGSAARFFYCPKADRADRNDGCEGMPAKSPFGADRGDGGGIGLKGKETAARTNHHPTVKPTDLMRYLCRLVTPKGGTVLDPFMGSGSTLKAAELEGFSGIGIEREAEYVEIARRRIASDMPLFA